MRAALAQGAFELHYQPQVDLRTDGVTGCEALLRWRHPVRGMVSPADFVPVAEETGLIEEIGQWVLRTACAEAAAWPADVRIAVNVSPIQFRSETLSLKVASVLAETGLDPRRLELEITEAVLIADDDAALATLNQLRALGVHIALDDFGTGYSSLQYLQRFPFDKIKIDRSFVKEVTRNSSSASIIRAVVSIAADRNMITTAEGVETLQQRETVQNLGCTQMQGFLFSAARPAQEIRALLASGEGGRRGRGVSWRLSVPGCSAHTCRRYAGRPGHKISKTTPCKVEWAPVRGTQAACVRGSGWSVALARPDLILLQRRASEIAFLRLRDSNSTE